MRSTVSKRTFLKRLIALNVMIFSSLISFAGFADKAKNAISKEFNSFEGIWIIAGLLGGGLGFYLLMSYISKKNAAKEAAEAAANPHNPNLRHNPRRRHKHRVVKKTS